MSEDHDDAPHGSARPDLATEDDVEDLVRAFYREAAADELLGPVFGAAEVDWATHIPHVTQFWVWQLLGGRRYDGRPLRAHERVHGLVPFTDAHYERWLELFTEALHERWSGPVVELAEHRARLMARSMRRVLDGDEDPEPSWAEEVGGATDGAAAGPAPGGRGPGDGPAGDAATGPGVVMRVALGRRPSGDRPRG